MPEILREHFQLKETIVTISAREQSHIEAAKNSIKEQRKYLEDFIEKDPFFMLTLDPYDLEIEDAPDIVQQMSRCSAVFRIGPMSAVAGVIAKFAVESMMGAGATYAVIDNGGDISIAHNAFRDLHQLGHRRAIHQLRMRRCCHCDIQRSGAG
jgi:ApbE superfamily uncharacterized protein (UPF0280 family)